MAQKEMSRATKVRLQTELRRIEAALARIEAGQFGECCKCHEAIEANRLQFDPATPFCLFCLEELTNERSHDLR